MHWIPGLRLRVSEKVEAVGIDEIDMGEFAYDYVGVDPEFNHHFNGAHPMEMRPISKASQGESMKERPSDGMSIRESTM